MKRIKTSICIAVLLTAVVMLPASADEGPAYERHPQALGIQYGAISGSGLSYYRWSDNIGFQIALGGLYDPTGDISWMDILDYSVGAELQYTVYGDSYAKWLAGQLYLFTGLNHRGVIERKPSDPNGDLETEAGPYIPSFTTGFGIGIEVVLFNHFSVPLEFGYAAAWKPSGASLQDQLAIKLITQAGFRYRF